MPQTSWHLKKVLSSVLQKSQAASGLSGIAKSTASGELFYHITGSFFWLWNKTVLIHISGYFLSQESLKAKSK